VKWFFFILLAVNIVFFSYHYLTSPADKLEVSLSDLPHDGSIILLSEAKDQVVSPVAIAKVEEATVQEKAVEVSVVDQPVLIESCFELASSSDAARAKTNLDKLIDAGFVGSVVESQVEVLSGYWVVTQPYDSRKQALKDLRQMHKLSIDSYIIESGDKKNSISVGLFSKKHHALKRKAVMAKHGFKVVLKENFRSKNQYKVDIVYRGINKAPSPATIVGDVDGEIEFIEKKCPEKRK